MLRPERAGADHPRHPHLFSAFLSTGQRVNRRRASLGFSVDLGVRVPEYEVDGRLWFDDHYEGSYLYREKLNLKALPPLSEHQAWRIRYGSDQRTPSRASQTIEGEQTDAGTVCRIPVSQDTRPGLKGELVLTARPWNWE